MQPLANRMRPCGLEEMIGQKHLIGSNGVISRMLASGRISNMIFYGPPGTGKTTVANIIAKSCEMQLYKLNATNCGIAEIKAVIAETETVFANKGVLLYLDEIQYFNKKQQQSLLEFVEDGRITLIASTTENPYFYIFPALLSRCTVLEFYPVPSEEIEAYVLKVFEFLNKENNKSKILSADAARRIAQVSCGDVRRSIGISEEVYYLTDEEVCAETVDLIVPKVMGAFGRDGDEHYDLLSAFQKSIRGSDPDAAIFYLAKLLDCGELLSVCRRLQVIASEDVGLAFSNAAVICRACVESARELGMPEASVPLSHATIALATAPKSDSAVAAYQKVLQDLKDGRGNEIPAYLRDAHYKGAERLSRGVGYQYPHSYPNHYVKQQYLPDDLATRQYYSYADNKNERAAEDYWKRIKNL